MSMSSYLSGAVAEHSFGISPWTPSTVYLGLLSEVDSNGLSYTEVSGAGYARQSLTMSTATIGSIANTAAVVFPPAEASWGDILYTGVFNAASGGQLLWYTQLDAAKSVSIGAVFQIPVGSLTYSLGGAYSLYLRNGILNLVFNGAALASPTNVYAGIGASVGSNNASLSEPTPGYSRLGVDISAVFPSYVISANGSDPDLLFIADGGDWGNITHVGLYDAESSGNLLYTLGLDPVRIIYDKDGIKFTSIPISVTLQVN